MINLEDIEKKFDDNFNDFQAIDELLADFKAQYNDVEGDKEKKDSLLKEIENQRKILKQRFKDDGDDDWTFDYDFSKYNAKLTPIEELNKDDLPYPIFLRDVILPNFYPLPYSDIQNSIVATLCLFNSASLPPEGSHGKSEVLLPTVYIQGQSGSGKSEIAGLFQNHYPPKRRKSIKGSDTGGSMVEQLTNACHRAGTIDEDNLKFYPAIAVLENFYFKNLERWKDWSVQLLATNREMAQFQRKGKEPKDFVTYLLKVFTSVEPLQAIKQQHAELLRRTIRVFTKPAVPTENSSIYNWEYCKNCYKKLWHPERVEESYLNLLQEVQMKNPDNSPIPNAWYPTSVMLVATGVFMGIWESVQEAEDHVARYWQLVDQQENKQGKAYMELYKDILNAYYREKQERLDDGEPEWRAKYLASQEKLLANSIIDHAHSIHGKFHHKNELSEALTTFMESQGFIYTTTKLSEQPIFMEAD